MEPRITKAKRLGKPAVVINTRDSHTHLAEEESDGGHLGPRNVPGQCVLTEKEMSTFQRAESS